MICVSLPPALNLLSTYKHQSSSPPSLKLPFLSRWLDTLQKMRSIAREKAGFQIRTVIMVFPELRQVINNPIKIL